MNKRELLTQLGFTLDKSGLREATREVESTMGKISGQIKGALVGAGIFAMGKAILDATGEMESMSAQFETMMGSADKSAAFMDKIQKKAAETSFETKDIARSLQTMMQFGMSDAKAFATMEKLGDVAGASKEKLGQLSLVMGQVSSLGRLQGGDLLQLINAGWNPLNEIAKQTNKSMTELRKDMEKGKISFEMVEKALDGVTSKGGMFYQNQLKQSKTWIGVVSTAVDNFMLNITKATMALMPAFKAIVGAISGIPMEWLGKVTREVADALKALNKALTDAGFYAAFKALGDRWSFFLKQLLNVQEAVPALKDLFAEFADVVTNLAWGLALAATLSMQFVLILKEWAPVLHEIFNLLVPIGILLVSIYSAEKLAMIWATVAAVARQVVAYIALNGTLLIANFRMAAQGGLLSVLQLGWSLLTGGIFKGVGAMRAFGVASMTTLGAVGAALAALYWAYTRIMDALEERSQRIQQEQYDTARGQIEDEMKVRRDKLRAAKARGNAAEIEQAQKHYDALAKTYRKEWVDKKDRPGDAGPAGTDFSSDIKVMDQNLSVAMQKEVQAGAKNTNITNKLDFSVNVPPGSEAGTGLTPNQVGKVATNAAHSVLSMTMMEMVNGSL